MSRRTKPGGWLLLLAGAAPLATVATCDRYGNGGNIVVTSSNDHLFRDTVGFLFGGDCDDDDCDDWKDDWEDFWDD